MQVRLGWGGRWGLGEICIYSMGGDMKLGSWRWKEGKDMEMERYGDWKGDGVGRKGS